MATAAPSKDSISALVTTGYLGAGDVADVAKVTRAITRFQRHAARGYRVPQPDAGGGDLFGGKATGICDAATAAELKKWIDHKVGSSRYSFHYCARAVDISQDFTLSKNHRYFIVNEPVGAGQFWRIYCKTDKQDGSQGSLIRKGVLKHQQFKPVADLPLPEGYYVDLTALIESTGKFERIKAQGGWQSSYNKAEWWHFQYKLDKQATFLDEMELIGYSERKLQSCGWQSPTLLDHAPG
jgi:hypothetical protein